MLYRKIVFIISALLCSLASIAQYNIDRLLIIGRNALYFEDYVLSIQYFNQAITAKPYLYEPWFYRAVAKYNLDDFTGAEADCSQAISINPFITNIYELRGLARIQQEKYTEAITDYDRALKYDPENQSLWHNRTLCRIQNKDYDHALNDLDTILTRWKQYARGYAMQAEVYIHKKDTTKAMESLNKSVDIDPYESGTWQALASINLSRKKWKEAEKQLDKAIHLRDFILMGELVAYDALHREESCGGHFREEHQTENFFYVGCWEYQKNDETAPELIKEPLHYEIIKVQQRNYKN